MSGTAERSDFGQEDDRGRGSLAEGAGHCLDEGPVAVLLVGEPLPPLRSTGGMTFPEDVVRPASIESRWLRLKPSSGSDAKTTSRLTDPPLCAMKSTIRWRLGLMTA